MLTSLSPLRTTLKRSSHLGVLLQPQALWSAIKQQAGGVASSVALVKSLFNFGDLMDILTERRERNLRKAQFLPVPKGRGFLAQVS